jgi:agmatinase
VLEQIERTFDALLGRGVRILALGGDHAITYPIVRAHGARYGDLNILHLDAHPDLYDEYEGNRHSHACPFARIMEEGLARRLVQVGIRTMSPHQRAQAERFGVEVIDMPRWQPEMSWQFDGPVYLSVDMDVLDPAFAPGVSHREPGGLSTREVIRLIQSIGSAIAGADIVEFNPERDPTAITAMAAAKFVKEIAASMLMLSEPLRLQVP